MTSRVRPLPEEPSIPSPTGLESLLPSGPLEFRAALRRRLALIDQEIRALDEEGSDASLLDASGDLSSLRVDLIRRLTDAVGEEAWEDAREQLIVLWRRYRVEFERLATERGKRCVAMPGRGSDGPRW